MRGQLGACVDSQLNCERPAVKRLSPWLGTPRQPSERCGRWLDAWCDRHCPHRAEHGALRALFDAAQHEMQPRWRCYAASTLNAARTRFESGETYCTRDVQLRKEWARCESETGELPGEATGAASRTAGNVVQPPMPYSRPRPSGPPPPPGPWVDGPRAPPKGTLVLPAPQYEHDASLMKLPDGLAPPTLAACAPAIRANASFLGVSLYSASYESKARPAPPRLGDDHLHHQHHLHPHARLASGAPPRRELRGDRRVLRPGGGAARRVRGCRRGHSRAALPPHCDEAALHL